MFIFLAFPTLALAASGLEDLMKRMTGTLSSIAKGVLKANAEWENG